MDAPRFVISFPLPHTALHRSPARSTRWSCVITASGGGDLALKFSLVRVVNALDAAAFLESLSPPAPEAASEAHGGQWERLRELGEGHYVTDQLRTLSHSPRVDVANQTRTKLMSGTKVGCTGEKRAGAKVILI